MFLLNLPIPSDSESYEEFCKQMDYNEKNLAKVIRDIVST